SHPDGPGRFRRGDGRRHRLPALRGRGLHHGPDGLRRRRPHPLRRLPGDVVLRVSTRPIGDYALLSDCRSAALVSSEGSVDWLCFPRFDGPSVFGRILDERAGHWSIRPAGEFTSDRSYLEDTMVLETTFRTPTGAVALLDGLAVGRNERGHELGAGATSALLRKVTGLEGTVELEMEFAPRPEYGLVLPLLEAVDGGVRAKGGPDVMTLSAP